MFPQARHENECETDIIEMTKQNKTCSSCEMLKTDHSIMESYNATSKYFQQPAMVECQSDAETPLDEHECTVFMTADYVREVISTPRLIMLSGNKPAVTFPLNQPKMIIGRDRNSHIQLKEKSVSLIHAMICSEGNDFFLKELNSTNGTTVNGHRLKDAIVLRNGDKIEIGSALFTFICDDPVSPPTNRMPIGKMRFIASMLAIAGIIVAAICIPFVHIDAGENRPAVSRKDAAPNTNDLSKKEKMQNQDENRKGQQISNASKQPPLSPDQKGSLLAEKAIQYYITGDFESARQMLEETLRLDLPADSAIKARALALRDKISLIHELCQQGFVEYQNGNLRPAIEVWAQVLTADQQIVGQKSSYISIRIAGYTGDIFYRKALESLNDGNKENARQYCSQTFRIEQNHKGCIEIMNALSNR